MEDDTALGSSSDCCGGSYEQFLSSSRAHNQMPPPSLHSVTTDILLMRCVGRAQANARAKRAERASRAYDVPLGTQIFEAGLWDEPLPGAEHVEYRSLPERPHTMTGKPLLGWIPSQWIEAHRIASTVCAACHNGEENQGNLILLCDGENCHRAYHMACLEPPLKRMPARNRSWFCPKCRTLGSSTRKSVTAPKQVAVQTALPSAYELQRLDNIARNQRVLEELGLLES